MKGAEQPPRATSARPVPTTRAVTVRRGAVAIPSLYPLVVVYPPVGLDELDDARLVEVLERLDPGTRGERNARLHPGIWREHHAVGIALHDRLELVDQLGTAARAVVLDVHATVLEVVDLQLLDDGLGVHPPRGQIRQVRTGRGRGRVV